MGTSSVSGLLNNAVLLLALGVIYDVLGLYTITNKVLREILSGILIGSIGIAVMLTPWELTPGVFFDTRWVLLSSCGLFFGVVPTAIAVLMTGAFRLFQGGAGAIVGTVVIFVTAAVGLGWRHWKINDKNKYNWLQMYLFGVVVQLAMLSCMILMPADIRWIIIATVGPPILAIYPVLTMLMGLLLGRQQDRQVAENEIKFKNTVLATQQESSIDGILTIDASGMIISSNRRYRDMWGVTSDLVDSKSCESAMQSILDKLVNPNLFVKNARFLHDHNAPNLDEVALKDGRTIERYSSPMFGNDGQYFGHQWSFRDITEQRRAEELIRKQANFDSVTELPNRNMLYDRLALEIKKAQRSNFSMAVMFLDLDQFKEVNDTLGHHMGDLLLNQTAKRLRNCVRESDTVARQGGDEFTIILGEIKDSIIVERVAEKILKALVKPFRLEGGNMAYISASIGITFYPEDGTEVGEILKNADQAMYAAKSMGRNRFSYFTSSMQESALARMEVANDLRYALRDNQFTVHYQPIVDLVSGSILKAETLIRWQHPAHGIIYPDEFIHIAEETGVINSIGEWVFQQAALQVTHWRKTFHADFQLSINISPAQFRDERCNRQDWLIYLKKLGLPGQAIAIEITEGLLLDTGSKIGLKQLLEFRDANIQISLDDFGTGYSSLSYLKKFKIDYLKIDRSFVRNLEPQSDDAALCDAIIVMAHKLGIKVIAEGIEAKNQRDLLAEAGCDYGQGNLFSEPVPAHEFEKMLSSSKAANTECIRS